MAISKQNAVSKKRKIEMNDQQEILDSSERKLWIEEAAYFMAEARGFSPGYEEKDWALAEKNYKNLAA
jgi:hypothetical protein